MLSFIVFIVYQCYNIIHQYRTYHRDADLMSDTISEGYDDRDADILSDEESSFFARNMDEITRITSRKASSSTGSTLPAVSSGKNL